MIKEKSSGLVDIAFACGFSSHTHMSRMFRQAIGITPSEYRRAFYNHSLSQRTFRREHLDDLRTVEAINMASQVA
jgi:AraC-like DNA-binding protein